MKDRPTCQTCRHLCPPKAVGGPGQCRAKPPTCVLLGPDRNGQMPKLSIWPDVQRDQWCGEHAPLLEVAQ